VMTQAMIAIEPFLLIIPILEGGRSAGWAKVLGGQTERIVYPSVDHGLDSIWTATSPLTPEPAPPSPCSVPQLTQSTASSARRAGLDTS
jgi:hypothetical protein